MVDEKDMTKDNGGSTEPNEAEDAIPGDMNELYCDVDEETPNNSRSATTKAPKTVVTITSKSFEYPSKEAKVDASTPEEPSKTRSTLPQEDPGDIHKTTTTNSNISKTITSYDTVTHRMKPKTKGQRRRRRNRRDYGSDEESDPSDSNNDELQAYHPRIGAVAVDSTGAVPQRPGVLTQQHPQEQSLDDGMQTTTDGGDTWIDATVTTAPLSRATTTAAAAASDLEMNKPDHDPFPKKDTIEGEKPVDLPWYWSHFFWIMMAVLVIALGVIVTVVMVVLGKKDPTPAPTPSPTVTPIDRIKEEAFERYIGEISDDSTPQWEAFRWLTTEDEITNFSENMTQDDVDMMKTRYSLAVLYFALGGENWLSSTDWLGTDVAHCSWRFVSCPPEGYAGLFLENNNLHGTLPSELAYLSTLGTLHRSIPNNLSCSNPVSNF